jgi:hypothetical protein
LGNPDDVVEKYNEQQKNLVHSRLEADITRKFSSAHCLDALHPATNSLLQRRARRKTSCH